MIIPKKHYSYFTDMPDEMVAHITIIGNKLGKKMLKVLKPKPKRIGFVVHGYIPHVHYHIVPQYTDDDITSSAYATIINNEIKFDATLLKMAKNKDQSLIAKKIRI